MVLLKIKQQLIQKNDCGGRFITIQIYSSVSGNFLHHPSFTGNQHLTSWPYLGATLGFTMFFTFIFFKRQLTFPCILYFPFIPWLCQHDWQFWIVLQENCWQAGSWFHQDILLITQLTVLWEYISTFEDDMHFWSLIKRWDIEI